jgi:type II secretory pathway component PulK
MRPGLQTRSGRGRRSAHRAGSVLIIVLWVSFGLVSLALYFAHSMSFELRAADNRSASLEAEQAIAGAARYVSNILANVQEPGLLPDAATYRCEAVPVGSAAFWLIGRGDAQIAPDRAVFGLVDEASKLNLNTATVAMLQELPRMTPELAAAIVDWRDADDEVTSGGAESQTYLRLNPPYRCKNANFESVDELRLVYGADLDILYGEDANLNGILDPNENDADVSSPIDNRDGRLDPGILEYLTIWSRQPNTGRTNVSNQQQLAPLLQERFGTDRANQILRQLGGGPGPGGGGGGGGGGAGAGTTFSSVLEFYIRSGMSMDEFTQIEAEITVTNSATSDGLVNVNTASEAVLACIPGIGLEKAPSLVAYRKSNSRQMNSIAWVKEVLEQSSAIQAGPYLTGRSYQVTADIAAVGHHGRGYQRVRFVFDTRDGTPKIVHRQDLTHLGWALGRDARNTLLLVRNTR